MPGNGKLTCTGIGSGKEPKEATNTAFNYLKANGNRIPVRSVPQQRIILSIIRICRALEWQETWHCRRWLQSVPQHLARHHWTALQFLVKISIGGTLIKVDELASTLQVCLDSGAKKVLLPITSAGDLGTVPSDLVGAFSLIFYSSAEEAVFKALGVE